MSPLVSHPVKRLAGAAAAPGDKSISHRALMLGAASVGETVIEGLLEGADILATGRAVAALGAGVERLGEGRWRVRGRGVGGFAEPASVLDLGNAGTGVRLLMGLVATHPFVTFFTGDESLVRRPMGRVIEPLSQMGAQAVARTGARLPLALIGAAQPVPIRYRLPVASAQVKSAILLAGLNAPGITTVIEPRPSRDHTERLLTHLGAEIEITTESDGARAIALRGQPELTGRPIAVPGDPSSAAFALVAALIAPEASVTLRNVGINPMRAGLFDALEAMGATLRFTEKRELGGEPVADIEARPSALRGIDLPAEAAPAMIDEYPILAIAAAAATGTTVLRGLGELRVKESDRLSAVARGLAQCGVEVEEGPEHLVIHGCGGPPPGLADPASAVATHLDHRIAMAFLVLGMAARAPVLVDDGAMIETSFPGFIAFMNRLGADIGPAGRP